MRALLLFVLFLIPVRAQIQTLDGAMHHLGVAGDPEWDGFRNVPVEDPKFELRFNSRKNTNEWTLFLRQRDVKVHWALKLNGRTITNLFLAEEDLVNAFAIAPGALLVGTNTLALTPPKERDDIEVGEIRIDQRPVAEALNGGTVDVQIVEGNSPVPSRLTIVDKNGSLFPALIEATNTAVRPGVAYLGEGRAKVRLPIGDYTFYAGRGFEYSVSTQRISIVTGKNEMPKFGLKREVKTPGWVACDR
jgi:hypothetical protein